MRETRATGLGSGRTPSRRPSMSDDRTKPPTDVPMLVGVVNPPTLLATTPVEQNFGDLYQRVCGRAVRQAEWFIEDHDAAWDAVQETALKFFRTWERLAPEQKNDRYFMRAVHHRVIEHLRRERKYVELTAEVEQELADAGELDPPSLIVATEGLEVAALINQIARRFPVRVREVWVLFREQKVPYPEIAETLGISEVTARRHMSRAMEILRTGVARAGYRLADTTIKGLLPPSTSEGGGPR